MSDFSLKAVAAAVLASTAAFSAFAAVVDDADLRALSAEARTNGAVPVVVNLASVSLEDLNNRLAAVKADVGQRSERLLAELGAHAWQGGRWDNGVGQIGLYVDEAGLKLLQGSGNALSFRKGAAWTERTALDGRDGRHAEIERRLARDKLVDVVVTLNVDALEYELDKNGAPSFRGNPHQAEQARARARALVHGLSEKQSPGRAAAVAKLDGLAKPDGSLQAPEITLRVDREGLIKLVESEHVRSVRPAGFKDTRPLRIDDDVMAAARRYGHADVVVTIRTPLAGGKSSKESFAAEKRSNKRNMDALMAEAGVKAILTDLSTFGAASGRLTLSDLEALRLKGEGRLVSIELNRPMGSVSLTTAMRTINMPPAWSANFRAAGQNIIVMDSGTQSSHLFLRNAAGASRVVFEGCFGTNAVSGNVSYRSVCPMPAGTNPATWDGDSVLGQVGSAAPVLNCSSQEPKSCHHGTHVAGIAAGRWYPGLPGDFQGVGPDANIVALQVFSYDVNRIASPTTFLADLLKAMQAAANAMDSGSTSNPFVVNLSLGNMGVTGAGWGSPCGNANVAYTTAVQTLFNRGVPVVAATGNNFSNSSIAWPACVPKVVKVASVHNDGVGNTRASFANLAPPSNFPGERFWLAPGGGGGTEVISSGNSGSGNHFLGMPGTSQAAPQVSGVYAALKAAIPGISVDGASAWIHDSGSQSVSVNLCSQLPCPPGSTVTFRRLRLPNF